MKDGLIEQGRDVLVMQAVEHLSPAALADHEPHSPQHTQLVGDRGLRHPNLLDDLRDRLRTLTQTTENVHSAGSRERLHHLRHALGYRAGDSRPARLALNSVAHFLSLPPSPACTRLEVTAHKWL